MKPKVKALLRQIESGQLDSDLARVLDYIKGHPYTTLPEIKRKLSMSHQTASARLSDLQDLGLVEEVGEKKTTTSHFTYFKYQPDIKKQETLAKERKHEKYKTWLKKGLYKFEEFINPQLKQELQYENNHKLQTGNS